MVESAPPLVEPPWRVVVFTNIPGGRVYTLLDETMRSLGHRIVGVVTTPGPPKRRSADYLDVAAAVRPGIDVIVTSHPNRLARMLEPLRPDLIISGGFPWLIPADVAELPRLGAINMHPALLPKYRGPAAVEWAFRNGDPELGFTIHRISNEFDGGPILAQGRMAIDDDDDIGTLMGKMGQILPTMIARALERIARGKPGDAQDEASASYAGAFEEEWRAIDWTSPARAIHNQVRSWTGIRDVPRGALGTVDGELLVVLKTRLPRSDGNDVAPALAGTTLSRNQDRFIVQCGDGPLEILAWSAATS
jgi:methionyl-tRNA formyltransferase